MSRKIDLVSKLEDVLAQMRQDPGSEETEDRIAEFSEFLDLLAETYKDLQDDMEGYHVEASALHTENEDLKREVEDLKGRLADCEAEHDSVISEDSAP